MSAINVRVLVPAAAAVALALAACQKPAPTLSTAAPPLRLDESKLIQPIRFSCRRTSIRPSPPAGPRPPTPTANGSAANAIPADQVRWGRPSTFCMNRSLGVRRQIAEQMAAEPQPTGIDKIIADFWATGMDQAKRNADGVAPLARTGWRKSRR